MQAQLAGRSGAFHQADRADPLFARFDGLHQTSTKLFMVGLAAAFVCFFCMTHSRTRQPNTQAAAT